MGPFFDAAGKPPKCQSSAEVVNKGQKLGTGNAGRTKSRTNVLKKNLPVSNPERAKWGEHKR